MILGIDEVGRGVWAGPLVVGAVVLGNETIDRLADSKQISKRRRESVAREIHMNAASIGLGWVTAGEIDEIGLGPSLRLGARRAVKQAQGYGAPFDQIIIDGTSNLLSETALAPYVTTLKKADALIPSVSAASIVAKVARDEYMTTQDDVYPGYGFANHVGYGTKLHRDAIERLGITPLHRLSIAPLARYRAQTIATTPSEAPDTAITTVAVGNASEEVAASELQRRGHTIIARNWRTKTCEIDIVSKKAETLYFVEVKHRRIATQGDGLAAITTTKQKQMHYAARLYVHRYKLHNHDMRLLAIATSGNQPIIESVVELL